MLKDVHIDNYLLARAGEEPVQGAPFHNYDNEPRTPSSATFRQVEEEEEEEEEDTGPAKKERNPVTHIWDNTYQIAMPAQRYYRKPPITCDNYKKTYMDVFNCCRKIYCCGDCHDMHETHMYADVMKILCLKCTELTSWSPAVRFRCENCACDMYED
jgi:hypothetical protein